jgi:hypothetical protein
MSLQLGSPSRLCVQLIITWRFKSSGMSCSINQLQTFWRSVVVPSSGSSSPRRLLALKMELRHYTTPYYTTLHYTTLHHTTPERDISEDLNLQNQHCENLKSQIIVTCLMYPCNNHMRRQGILHYLTCLMHLCNNHMRRHAVLHYVTSSIPYQLLSHIHLFPHHVQFTFFLRKRLLLQPQQEMCVRARVRVYIYI